jgi:hypothetical protein
MKLITTFLTPKDVLWAWEDGGKERSASDEKGAWANKVLAKHSMALLKRDAVLLTTLEKRDRRKATEITHEAAY